MGILCLHHRTDKDIIKDIFDWCADEGVRYAELQDPWKRTLAEEIRNRLLAEEIEVKPQSVYRNINRMISYYFETGAQARSGKRYLPHIEKWLRQMEMRVREMVYAMGGHEVARFKTLAEARAYVEGISVLFVYFHPDSKLWIVYKIPSK